MHEFESNSVSRRSVLLAFPPLLLGGCEKKPDDLILGRWKSEKDKNLVVEYFKDGTFRLSATQDRKQMDGATGKWSIIPDNRLKIELTHAGTTKSFLANIRFEGKDMFLKGEDGVEERNTRE